MNKELPCDVCGESVKWKGLCKKHYYEQYNKINKEKIKETNSAYRKRYEEKGPLTKEEWKIRNEKRAKKEYVTTRKYIGKNKEEIRRKERIYKRHNWPKIKKKLKHKYHTNMNYKMSVLLRNRLAEVMRKNNTQKCDITFNLLGCSKEFFIKHIEKQFQEGMNWANHSFTGWHIDHIIPISHFELSVPQQQKECFHYTNLQPLWSTENFIKGTKIEV